MIEQLLMSRIFRRYIEAWTIILAPWVLFSERKAVTIDGFSPSQEFNPTPDEEQEMEESQTDDGCIHNANDPVVGCCESRTDWWASGDCIGHDAVETTCDCESKGQLKSQIWEKYRYQ